MKEERYPFRKIHEEFYYEFFSEGPKGKIRKIVRYKCVESVPHEVFNLSFGDRKDSDEDLDDMVTTNNGDRKKVLATVANTVLEFTKDHPGVFVFIQGSTRSRTRLYQMGISSFWKEIGSLFIVSGYVEGEWLLFDTGINYEAFLIKRK